MLYLAGAVPAYDIEKLIRIYKIIDVFIGQLWRIQKLYGMRILYIQHYDRKTTITEFEKESI